jgi:hypothetical protein
VPTSKPAQPERELAGWKAIATYLDVSIRTAQNHQHLGLPVRRLDPGRKARVWAYPSELEAWKRQSSPKLAAPATRTGKPSHWLRYSLLALGALALAALALYLTLPSQGPPAVFRIQSSDLTIADARGRVLWRYSFPLAVDPDSYSRFFGFERCTWGDIDGDGRPETLFAYLPLQPARNGTALLCFSQTGKILWRFTPGRAIPDAPQTLLPPYLIRGIEVILPGPRSPARVVLTSQHYYSYPNQVAVLDSHGKLVGEYWHAGHLLHMAQADLDGDGNQEILLTGVNNGHNLATLVVLDPHRLSGASPTPEGDPPRFQGLGPGAEKAVVLFPRSCLARQAAFTRAQALWTSKDRIIVLVLQGTSDDEHNSPGYLVYELDYKLNVLGVTPSDSFQTSHRELEAKGQLDHRLSSAEIDNLRRVQVIRRNPPT